MMILATETRAFVNSHALVEYLMRECSYEVEEWSDRMGIEHDSDLISNILIKELDEDCFRNVEYILCEELNKIELIG